MITLAEQHQRQRQQRRQRLHPAGWLAGWLAISRAARQARDAAGQNREDSDEATGKDGSPLFTVTVVMLGPRFSSGSSSLLLDG